LVADFTTAGTAVGVGIDFGAEACSVDFFPVVAAAARTGGTVATVSGLEGGTLGALGAAGLGDGVRGFSFGSAALGNDGGTGDGFGVFAAGGTEGFTGAFATGAAAAGTGLDWGEAFLDAGGVGFATALGADLVAGLRTGFVGALGFPAIGAGGTTGFEAATGFAGGGVESGLVFAAGSFEGAAFVGPLGGGALASGEEAEGDAAAGERVGPGLVGFFTGAKSETASPPRAMGFHARCEPARKIRKRNR
jgi:hypothetical protein